MLMLRLLIDKASSEEKVDWFMERLNKQVFQLSEISLVAACVASLRTSGSSPPRRSSSWRCVTRRWSL